VGSDAHHLPVILGDKLSQGEDSLWLAYLEGKEGAGTH
jgi:hypothetical protein